MSELLPASLQGYTLFAVEVAAILVALYLALVAPRLGGRFFRAVSARGNRLARRPVWSLVAIAVAPALLRLLLLPLLSVPKPFVHDEFSYLLAADTFAHGRLANPSHPLWIFFESFHILQVPVYASMYGPGQGMFLAAGRLLTGQPWIGVCLSVGLLCAALLWMLRGWFPPGWALLGASIAVIRLGLFSYWMNSYWGGAVGALGGALALGALPRLWKRPRPIHGAIMGLGFVILACTRPYEGFVFSLPVAAALLWRSAWRRALVSLPCVLALGAAGLAYYNWRLTGSPFVFPEQLNRRQYAILPSLVLEGPHPEPVYRHEVLRNFYIDWESGYIYKPDSALDYASLLYRRLKVIYLFFLGPVLLFPLLLQPQVFCSRKLAPLGVCLLVVIAGLMLETWPLNPHYCSPLTCVIYAFVVAALRRLRYCEWRGKPVGLSLVRSIPAICVLLAVVRLCATPLGIQMTEWPLTWYRSFHENRDRARLLADLQQKPEFSLVVVRYSPDHELGEEWVYNEAYIDGAKVVWAREMPHGNRALLDYFAGRKVYLLEPDMYPPSLQPYKPRD